MTVPSFQLSHLSSLSTPNPPPPPTRSTSLDAPRLGKPKMLFFPFDFHSSRLAPRASQQTKHQKPGLAVQEGNPLTWGLSHDPAAPSRHPREQAASGTKGRQVPLPPCPARAPKILLPCHHLIFLL